MDEKNHETNNYGYFVHVKPYCRNCLEFEPVCIDSDVSSFDWSAINHNIYCEYRDKCARMNAHIQKMTSKAGKRNASKE